MGLKVIETILLNTHRIRAKRSWDFSRLWSGHHAMSFHAPPMFISLMINGRIRLYPHDGDFCALEIFDDSNPYRLAITRKIIGWEIAAIERLDELGAPDYLP